MIWEIFGEVEVWEGGREEGGRKERKKERLCLALKGFEDGWMDGLLDA